MKILIRSFSLACIIAVSAVIAYAQGSLSGRITGPSGQAVPGASIKVSVPNGSFTRGGYSDSRGRYAIKGLPDGDYSVPVTCVGYQKNLKEGVAISGATTHDVSLVETAIDMDVTVVTASRVQQKASEAPASVTVVEPRAIREAPKATPVEHIRGLAGIDYSQTGIAQQNVSVRGFNNVFSGSLLTLTDYRPAGVPSLRVNVGYFIPAANEDIERMELVRGPASALYGPNASQGVLNIITRSPFASQGTTVFLAGGERGLINAGLRHAGTVGESFGYKITGQYFKADDWVFVDPVEEASRSAILSRDTLNLINRDTLKVGNRRNSPHERFNVDAGAYYMLGDNTMIQLNGGISQAVNTIEMTGLGAALGSDWRYTYVNAQLTSGDLFVQAFTNMSDAGNTYFLRTGNPIVDRSTLIGGRVQHAYNINDDIRLTYGADLFATNPVTDGTINGRNEDSDNYTEIGGYLQADWKITSDLSALAAIRADQHSVIGELVFSPRVALLYKLDENSSLRATFNTAFSNPGTNDLFLDLLSASDGFGLGAINRNWAVGVRGASAGVNGYTFNRDGGLLNYVSQFDSTRTFMSTGNVANMWRTVTAIVTADPRLAALRPLLTQLVPPPPAVRGSLGTLNPTNRSFIPTSDSSVQNVARLRQTSTQTIELGYQGKLTDKLWLSVDVYHSTVTDFVSPLKVVTPNVFLNRDDVASYLKPIIVGALVGQGLDSATANANADFICGAYASVPIGTVSPNETPYKGDILLAYRNYGQLSYYGSDVAFTYELSPSWSVSGSASYINQNVFAGEDLGDGAGSDTIALNAPQYKSALGIMHRNADLGLNIGLQWRWVDGFRMNSGVYVGDVNAYHMLDLMAQYAIPGVDGLSLNVSATNLLDNQVQQFIGAAAIGRLIQGRLTYTF
ncbi:MAG: TonB-dependent receptor domain-containing protein [Bacteroidota bacterium]